MQSGKRKWAKILLICLLAAVMLVGLRPKVRAQLFVARWGSAIEESLAAGNGVPAGVEMSYGNGDRIEFSLGGWGLGSQTSYYGCYYSYEDVPQALQMDAQALIKTGERTWQWQAEGDNHGMTEKLREHWYYYEMYF